MNVERERKFIVDPRKLPRGLLRNRRKITTGYFVDRPCAVRIAYREGELSKICVKGPGTGERLEFEYGIPQEDGRALLELAPTRIVKHRHDLRGWEIDEFVDVPGFVPGIPDEPLWLAEWEEDLDKPAIPDPLPPWILFEVTDNPAFSNAALAFAHGTKS